LSTLSQPEPSSSSRIITVVPSATLSSNGDVAVYEYSTRPDMYSCEEAIDELSTNEDGVCVLSESDDIDEMDELDGASRQTSMVYPICEDLRNTNVWPSWTAR
jgi:hypothetical protein